MASVLRENSSKEAWSPQFDDRVFVAGRGRVNAGAAPSAPEQDLGDELAAEVAQHQQRGPGEDPVAARAGRASRSASGRTAARANVSQPSDREDVLVRERHGRPKSCSEKRRPLTSVSVSSTKPAATRRNRKRSSVSSGSRAVGVRQREPAVQPLLEAGQQQRLQRGDDEQRVGDQRDGDVQRRPAARRRRESDAGCRRRAAPARTGPRRAG